LAEANSKFRIPILFTLLHGENYSNKILKWWFTQLFGSIIMMAGFRIGIEGCGEGDGDGDDDDDT